jgi:hypothetical protein
VPLARATGQLDTDAGVTVSLDTLKRLEREEGLVKTFVFSDLLVIWDMCDCFSDILVMSNK